MGFYSPHSLTQDARRHGVKVHPPDMDHSGWNADLEPDMTSTGGVALRLGFDSVRHVGEPLAKALAAGRPYTSIEDVARRGSGAPSGLSKKVLEALATAGAFRCFDHREREQGAGRREDLWSAGAAVHAHADRLPGILVGLDAPRLPKMAPHEEAAADLWSTGISADGHPTRFLRSQLDAQGVLTAEHLRTAEPDRTVAVAGVVTHRQRPATAGGTMFVNLEDETGLINVVCSLGCWRRYSAVVKRSPALLVRGRLERSEGVVNIIAYSIEPLGVPAAARSRDFR
jgi:error-prone DNA polymerase